jgi:hypothetical protein
MIKTFEDAVRFATGRSIEEIRETPIDVHRGEIEARRGEPSQFRSRFPLIGRGNVLRSRMVSHETVEKDFERALNGDTDQA